MTRRSASTTSPICSARRRRCSSAISSPPIASARSPSAVPVRAGIGHVSHPPGSLAGSAHRGPSARHRSAAPVVNHNFPLDAEYRFSLELYRTNLEAIRGLEHPHQIEITVDGERVFIATVGGENEQRAGRCEHHRARRDAVDARLQVRVPVKAGPHEVGATFVRKIGEGTQRLRPFLAQLRRHLRLNRPAAHRDADDRRAVQPTGPGRHAEPRSASSRAARRPQPTKTLCATKILSTLARRAYRRPVTKADSTSPARPSIAPAEPRGTSTAGIQMALRRLLASPTFVFRVEEDSPTAQAGHAPACERCRAGVAAVVLPLEQHP